MSSPVTSDRFRFRPSVEWLPVRVNPDAAWYSSSMLTFTADDGGPPVMRLLDSAGGRTTQFLAYDPSFRGGVRAAVGDVTGDGIPDVVTAPGAGGGPHVKVFDGRTGNLVREFFTYPVGFSGGVEVAVGDVDRDGFADVVTAAGPGGGPHVRVFSGKTGGVLTEFLAFEPAFRGGATVAVGDLNRDGYDDVIAGAGAGGGPRVQAWNLRTGTRLVNFFPFEAAFRGGVRVASADLNADGVDDLVAAAGPGGGARVRAYDLKSGITLSDRFVADAGYRNGVRVATAEAFDNGKAALVARTRTGDIASATVSVAGSSAADAQYTVWVGDGAPPANFSPKINVRPSWLSGDINPIRTIDGPVLSIAADKKSMTVRRGDGTPVTIDLDGDDPPPAGQTYIDFVPLPPAEFRLGDQAASVADLRVGGWVRVRAARAWDPAATAFTALGVRLL
jgi:hypothetical protein